MSIFLENPVCREALQARLLVELMSNAIHKELVLKGGMAMRALHGSMRYTKDLDLNAHPSISKERVQGIVQRSIKKALATSGLINNPKVTEPKQTDTTLRWKIFGTQPGGTEPIHVTIEVSRRKPHLHGHTTECSMPAQFGQPADGVKIHVIDSQHLAICKVLALCDPHRQAPRDIFDLDILIQATLPDMGALLAQIPDAAQVLPRALKELWSNLEAMPYEQFRQEVIPYLPADTAALYTESYFDTMRLKVGERVEQWLQEAMEKDQSHSALSTCSTGLS